MTHNFCQVNIVQRWSPGPPHLLLSRSHRSRGRVASRLSTPDVTQVPVPQVTRSSGLQALHSCCYPGPGPTGHQVEWPPAPPLLLLPRSRPHRSPGREASRPSTSAVTQVPAPQVTRASGHQPLHTCCYPGPGL